MTLAQCLRIKENQFRSADNSVDYCPFEIEQRIIDLKVKKASRLVNQVAPTISFDSQLGAQMQVTMPGKFLLALIDYALKLHKNATKTVEVEVYLKDQECSYEAEVTFDGEDFTYSSAALIWPNRDQPDFEWDPPQWVLEECEKQYWAQVYMVAAEPASTSKKRSRYE